ncbi:GlxA family transcriptional regulator [Nocardia huaxiensis]|uniref:Helix-turn-helix domain-containing protein n=1 Tax=Nocardia huaxiensis TaxID=2755382 RepID=A0A7D6Z5F6_9NOCA|nr:helix-turn-helix domain-containing protein [Nocardia huaxiensis]QLY33426.1 helix-turn-helix domain-containing protein [Nocardia huaxiensis]UFS99660.1 helix-turn-helix domain-containing protein [Nocardia huaxiensis]
MHQVAVLAFEQISPFHLSVPSLIFGRAGLGDTPGTPYEVRVCAENPGILSTPAGFDIIVQHGLEAVESAETVIIPSWRRELSLGEPTREALHRAHDRGARVVGLCLGSWAVAASGLADGREITTHWSAAAELARTFPAVQVRADTLWSDHGDLITSAGVAAALDCCLHLVRSDHGSRTATELARALVLAPHRSGSQAQYIPVAVPEPLDDDTLEHAMVWARTHLDEAIDLDAWARIALMSRRTFTRRFRERTGSSPQQWLLQQRVDRARLLLESTDETMDRIAADAGLGTAVNLRHHFHRALGTSPAAHRAAFRSTADRRAG